MGVRDAQALFETCSFLLHSSFSSYYFKRESKKKGIGLPNRICLKEG